MGLGSTFHSTTNTPIPVDNLTATSQTSATLRWQADCEFIDNPCCGTLEPEEGFVEADGSIHFAFTPNRAGTFYIAVTVADERGRQTCGEVVFKAFTP